jgi:large subunit ribosomal protein L17
MRHRYHRNRLNRPTGPRRALLRALAEALIINGRILTTETKAKTLRPFVEKLVTLGKKGTLPHRRQAFAFLQKKKAVHMLFTEIAPRFQERNGGYTRVVHSGQRAGDGAWMAYIEFVDFVPKPKKEKAKKTPGQASAAPKA